jgi:hypothetical protein
MNIPFASRLRAADQVLIQEIRGEIMFLNMSSESYFGLDAVGSQMYRTLVSADSVQAAFDALLQEYDVDAARLRNDFEELIAKLLENGLLRVEST